MTDISEKEFSNWLADQQDLADRCQSSLSDRDIQLMESAWRASREAIRVDLPHLFPFYREGVTEALHAHGIKVNQWKGEV